MLKHEINNFIISSAATLFTMFSTLVAIRSGFTHHLGRSIDEILMQLGLMPWHIAYKLTVATGSYSYVSVNKAVFILTNIIVGFFTFSMIAKRGTKCSVWIYGIFMTLVFALTASILTVQSGDPFNWLCVAFGVPVTLFIQLALATILLKRNEV